MITEQAKSTTVVTSCFLLASVFTMWLLWGSVHTQSIGAVVVMLMASWMSNRYSNQRGRFVVSMSLAACFIIAWQQDELHRDRLSVKIPAPPKPQTKTDQPSLSIESDRVTGTKITVTKHDTPEEWQARIDRAKARAAKLKLERKRKDDGNVRM